MNTFTDRRRTIGDVSHITTRPVGGAVRDHEGDADDLVEVVARFGKLWVRHLHDAIDQPGLNPARLRLLGHVAEEGASIMHDLAEALGTTPRNVTALVDGLEREGLVARRAHPHDRRATLIDLTAAGRRTTEAWWQDYQRRAGAVFAELPERDRRALRRILTRLEQSLQS